MRELELSEVESVSGGLGPPGSVAGGVYGGLTYLGSSTVTGDFSWGGLASSVGGGAAMGYVGGPVGSAVGRYLAPRVSYLGGMAQGFFE